MVLFDISKDPNEHTDLAASLPDVVKALKSRIDELYAEMAAGGTTGKMPQWIPYKTCDVPGGSCELEYAALTAAANKKGCIDPWVASEPIVGGSE
jgi:hypothetical protein